MLSVCVLPLTLPFLKYVTQTLSNTHIPSSSSSLGPEPIGTFDQPASQPAALGHSNCPVQ